MQAEYRRELTKSTLVLKDEYNCEQNSYQVRLLGKTNIPGVLPCHIQILDGELYFHYNATDYFQFNYYYAGRTMKSADIEMFLNEVQDVVKRVREYLLDPSSILLDPEYVFVSDEGSAFGFCYLPGMTQSFETAFGKAAEFILERLDYNDKDAVVLGYGIYRLVKSGHASLEQLLNLAEKEKKEKPVLHLPEEKQKIAPSQPKLPDNKKTRIVKNKKYKQWIFPIGLFAAAGIFACWRGGFLSRQLPIKNENIIETGELRKNLYYQDIVPVICVAVVLIMFVLVVLYYRKKKMKSSPMNIWDKYGFDQRQNPTVFLGELQRESPNKLVSMETQEEVLLRGSEFYVGKIAERGGLLLEHETVSRKHALLSKRGDFWYIEDCGSSNGTYVNGYKLSSGEAVQLVQGDEVRFADKEYMFL